MWTSAALLAGLVLTAAASLPQEADRYFQASKEYLENQKHLLQLFWRPQDPEVFPDMADLSRTFKLEEQIDHYQDGAHVKHFVNHLKAGLLYPRDRIYNQYSEHGRRDLQMVLDLLVNAKDFATFYSTAVYLRHHINLGVYYYALTTALEVREDTRDLYYPPLYEVYPYLFVDEKVIQQALDAKIRGLQTDHREKVVIRSNYSGYWDADLDPETSLRYFREDVGLNTLNAEFDRRLPAWWDSLKYQRSVDRKGELYLHYQRQLLARYYLERLSNHLGEIPYLTDDQPLPSYYPHLRHANGQAVPARQPYTYRRDTEETMIKEIDYTISNLWKAIDIGYIYDVNGTKIPLDYPHGVDVLGELTYFYRDSPNEKLYGSIFYDIFHQLGHMADPDEQYDLAPSALMRPETALRDPLYYSVIYKFFEDIYYRYIEKVPKITHEDVYVPGLKIEDVHVGDLVTYFEDFDVNLANVHNMAYKKDKDMEIYARLRRLNHRHFNYKVSVNSDKDMDAVVKVYLTPKYDSQHRLLPLNKRVFYAFEIDRFITKVPAGKSVIERKCDESTVAVHDPPSLVEMWNKVEAALEDKEPLKVDKFARPYGFPQRLLLPKGTRAGLPLQFVVAVFPRQEADSSDPAAYRLDSFPLLGAGYDVEFPDRRPMSFPADRLYRSEHDARVPNIFTEEVRIFHKTLEEINSVPDTHQ